MSFDSVNARRPLLHAIMALLLVLSQQMGFAHALTHIKDDLAPRPVHGKQLPAERACQLCQAFSQLGTGIGPTPHALPLATASEVAATEQPPAPPGLQRYYPFRSRAPPR